MLHTNPSCHCDTQSAESEINIGRQDHLPSAPAITTHCQVLDADWVIDLSSSESGSGEGRDEPGDVTHLASDSTTHSARFPVVQATDAAANAVQNKDQQIPLEEALAKAEDVSEGVAELLKTKTFTREPPVAHKILENAEWLRQRVVAADHLDPKTPLIVVHWSVLKKLGRLPRNPDDNQYFEEAVNVIDNYTAGTATSLLVFCMVSHRWRRPDLPHPDSEDNAKARALAKYGDAARARNVDMYFWLDYAGVNQDDLRQKMVGISKLPCTVACCTEFLIFWCDDYESRAWTRMERFIGYVLSPCCSFRVIDETYGRPIAMELLTKSGAVVASKVRTSPPTLKVTDPLEGNLTSETDRQQLERLVKLGRMFPPVAYRGTCGQIVAFGKSKVQLIRMAGATSKSARAKRNNSFDFVMDIVDDPDDAESAAFKKATEDAFMKKLKEELIMGFGFTVQWFVAYSVLRSLAPLIGNGLWLAGAGISHCGGEQSFWVWVFEFEVYFMAVKGVMITCFYWLFMPRATPSKAHYTTMLHVLLTCMIVGFSCMMSFIWMAFGLHNDGTLSWLLYKFNFPLGASTAFATFAPIYLYLNYDGPCRQLALKRYVLLTVVLVCDVTWIAVSHSYVFFFNHAMDEWMPEFEDNFIVNSLLQLILVSGYTSVLMPVLGRVFWLGVFLVDKIAPMNDLQHERFIYFSTVICDMHRLMYARELFVNLNSHFLFYLILLKDCNYILYQFIIKAHPLWQTLVIGLFHPDGLQQSERASPWLLRAMKVIKALAELLECPKTWLSWHRVTIDAGFPDDKDAATASINFFVCDTMIILRNLPSPFSGKFAALKNMSEKKRKEAINTWIREANVNVRQQAAVEEASRADRVCEKQAPVQIVPDEAKFQRGKDSPWEIGLADMTQEMNIPDEPDWAVRTWSTRSSFWSKESERRLGAIAGVSWESEFYSYVSLRLNGIIFLRAQARLTACVATALSYIFMGWVIRSTPSRKVLNFVKDHKDNVEMKTVIAGVSFLITDLMLMALLNYFHLRKPRQRIFHMAKFGRIFQSKVLFATLIICTACCKSDFFLTYPDIKFCGI